MPRTGKQFYEFGPFRLYSREYLLLRQTEAVPLTPKSFQALLVLVENRGHLLGTDELMNRLWPDAVVEENNLAKCISAVRKALGEQSGGSNFIETVPRHGYRFVAPVKQGKEEPSRSHTGHKQRPSIVVLKIVDLEERSGSTWLSTAFAEMLTSELASGGRLRSIARDRVARVESDFWAGPVVLDSAGLRRLRNELGADFVVTGSFVDSGSDAGGQIRLDLRLQETSDATTFAVVAEVGSKDSLFDLVSRAGARLRHGLRLVR